MNPTTEKLDLELLTELCETNGVSGREEEIRSKIMDEIQDHVDSVEVDRVGNLIAQRSGGSPSIVFIAHMDEVGMMVRSITEEGTLTVSPIGFLDPASLIGQRVTVCGYVGILTTSLLAQGEELDAMPFMEDLYVDLGFSREEAEEKITPGDYVNLNQGGVNQLGGDEVICGKAMDDRVGCYTLLELAKNQPETGGVSFMFTVQEEVGMYGSEVLSNKLNADYAIIVDMMSHEDAYRTRVVGEGPCLTVMDGGLIANSCLNDWLSNVADELGISLQFEVGDTGVTDAMNVATARGGTPTTTIGVPVKNIHTKDSIVSVRDVTQLISILEKAVKDPVTNCRV